MVFECHLVFEETIVKYRTDSVPDHSQYDFPPGIMFAMVFRVMEILVACSAST